MTLEDRSHALDMLERGATDELIAWLVERKRRNAATGVCALCCRNFQREGRAKYCRSACRVRAADLKRRGKTPVDMLYDPYRRRTPGVVNARLKDVKRTVRRARHSAMQCERWGEAQSLEQAEDALRDALEHRKGYA